MTDCVAFLRLSWPAQPLWPNRSRGRSWKVSGDAKEAYRNEGEWVAKGQIGALRGTKSRHLCITFHKADRKRFDLDNALASLKPAIDGISRAWEVDDQEFTYTLLRGEPVKGGCVLIEVIACPPSGLPVVPIRGVIS